MGLNTLEQHETHWRLAEIGVSIELNRGVTLIGGGHVKSNCIFTDIRRNVASDGVGRVSWRAENNGVCLALKPQEAEWAHEGTTSVTLIVDANAPGPIAWATCAGYRYARELDGQDIGDALPFRCEITEPATP